jgi:RHS repeat-associated protein
MTREDGDTVWSALYYPFGETNTSGKTDNTHGFTGKEYDSEMGLNYFCQRYYDPQIGRFMALDPQDSPALSPYSYCTNNPLIFTDPTGEFIDMLVDLQGKSAIFSSIPQYEPGMVPYSGWLPSDWAFRANSAQMDPDFWAPGWDYHSQNPEFSDMVRWLSTGFGDVEIVTPEGAFIINIGQFIMANNIQIQYLEVPVGQSPTSTYGWCDVWDTNDGFIIGMQNNKINLNIGMQDDWSSGTRWAILSAAIAHEATHHWLAQIGTYSHIYHDKIAYFVSDYFLPDIWPFVDPFNP